MLGAAQALVNGAWLAGRAAKSAITHPEQLWLEVYGSRSAKSGVGVDTTTAMQAMAAFACVRVLAEGVAQTPFKLYRASPDGRGRAIELDHPLGRLLHRRPNEVQSAFEFREMLVAHAALAGNGFAFVNRTDGGRIVELLPLLPQWVTVRLRGSFAVEYELRLPDAVPEIVSPASLLHLKGPSWGLAAGLEPVRLAREALGLALATEEHAARLHGNGARPGGILTTDAKLGEAAQKLIKEAWQSAFTGAGAYKTAVLDSGLKWMAMGLSSVDAQHLETRRYQVEEICRAFRVFPLMVMQSDKTATFASAEQFFLAHIAHSLGPWYARIEQKCDAALLSEAEQADGLYTKHSPAALLRGDAAARANLYSRAILDGWMTRNEVRALEELNPLDGLDEPLRPLNMGPGSQRPDADDEE